MSKITPSLSQEIVTENEVSRMNEIKEYMVSEAAKHSSPEERKNYLKANLESDSVLCEEYSCTVDLPTGLTNVYFLNPVDPFYESTLPKMNSEGLNFQQFDTLSVSKSYKKTQDCSNTPKPKALLIQPFRTWGLNNANEVLLQLKEDLESKNYDVEHYQAEEAGLDVFEKIKDPAYTIILIATHGTEWGGLYTGVPYAKGDPIDKDIYFISTGLFNRGYIGIKPSWWRDIDLTNKVVALAACSALREKYEIDDGTIEKNLLRKIFIDKTSKGKLGAFAGYKWATVAPYTAMFMATWIQRATDNGKAVSAGAFLQNQSVGSTKWIGADYGGLLSNPNPLSITPNLPLNPSWRLPLGFAKMGAYFNESKDFVISSHSCGNDQPDHIISSIEIQKTAKLGETISVTARVQNIGTADSGPFRTGFYFSTNSTITSSDQFIGDCNHSEGVKAGEEGVCTISVKVPSDMTLGEYYIGAIADYKKEITESDESNNVMESKIRFALDTFNVAGTWVSDQQSWLSYIDSQGLHYNSGFFQQTMTISQEGNNINGSFRRTISIVGCPMEFVEVASVSGRLDGFNMHLTYQTESSIPIECENGQKINQSIIGEIYEEDLFFSESLDFLSLKIVPSCQIAARDGHCLAYHPGYTR